MSPHGGRHPIRLVAAWTGLRPEVIRVWERRYGAVVPARSKGGHRLFTDEDVRRLRLLRAATEAGWPIREVAGLPTRKLGQLVEGEERAASADAGGVGNGSGGSVPRAEAQAAIQEALEAIRGLDRRTLEETLRRMALAVGAAAFVEEVASPLIRRVGSEWEKGRIGPAEEHLASFQMRTTLAWLSRSVSGNREGPRIVAATPAGELHELGTLLACVTAGTCGWEPVPLGPNLPADEIARAAFSSGARAVALSVVYDPGGKALEAEVLDLRTRLPPTIALLIGGAAARSLDISRDGTGVAYVGSLAEFRRRLKEVSSRTPGTQASTFPELEA